MWNTFTINSFKIYLSTSAEEDRIMEQVFKRKNIRINKDLLQMKPNQGELFQHMNHVSIESQQTVIPQQQTLGDCKLCDEKFYNCFGHFEDHYHRRHHSKSLKIYVHLILHCKCKDVPYKGLDNYKRNSHWHCQQCYKPVNDRKQYAQHLRQKHNYHSTIIDELCSKLYPHW